MPKVQNLFQPEGSDIKTETVNSIHWEQTGHNKDLFYMHAKFYYKIIWAISYNE